MSAASIHTMDTRRALMEANPCLTALRFRYPGLCAWFGTFTRRWRNLLGERLVEAGSSIGLAVLVKAAGR